MKLGGEVGIARIEQDERANRKITRPKFTAEINKDYYLVYKECIKATSSITRAETSSLHSQPSGVCPYVPWAERAGEVTLINCRASMVN